MKFHILVNIELNAVSRVLAEIEMKRIYGGVDDCVAEQNDPKTFTIRAVLHDSKGALRTINVSKRPP